MHDDDRLAARRRASRPEPEHHDGGLAEDLRRIAGAMDRRQLLRWAVGAAVGATLLPMLGCGEESAVPVDGGSDGGTTGNGSCTSIPEETAGPYPGDGSNGPNVLTESGIVRSDIRSSIGSLEGTAEGVKLTVTLRLVDPVACAPLVGYAIYLWHCDRDGNYSLYTLPGQNYLRGVQETDASGQATFVTTFPGCYSGRWPHIHFEIYPSLSSATSAGSKLSTSQLALPEAICDEVYARSGYQSSVGNLGQISLDSDNVFSDGASAQLAAVSGSVSGGYTARLTVAIAG